MQVQAIHSNGCHTILAYTQTQSVHWLLDMVWPEEFTLMFLTFLYKLSLSLCSLAYHCVTYRVLSDSIKFWEAEN